MPKSTMEEEAQWKLPLDTPLPAALVKVSTRTIDYTDKKTNKPASFDKWEWEFAITEGEYAGLSAWGDTEDKLTTHPDNKVRQWAETLRGKEFELGEGLDTDDLLGLECVITVDNTIYTKKDGTLSYLCPVSDVFPKDALAGADPWQPTQEPPF